MKVQLFPSALRGGADPQVVFSSMGALTLKPSAYGGRPWEVVAREVRNYFGGTDPLTFRVRGTRVVAIGAAGWLADRVRFAYDGFRRQRLIHPRWGHPRGWSSVLGGWIALVGGRRVFSFLDGWFPHWGQVHRAYRLSRDGRGQPVGVSFDESRLASVFHGVYGPPGLGAALALPAWSPYEVEHLVRAPAEAAPPGGWSAVVVQLVGLLVGSVIFHRGGWWSERLGSQVRTVYQVSPLQLFVFE